MEDMWTILVNIYPHYILTIDISAKMAAFIYYQATFSLLSSEVCKRSTK